MGRFGRREVAEALRERVASGLHYGRFVGGERLASARDLAEEFSVNERVVLAALRVLATEGMIQLRPRSGAYVVPPRPAGGPLLPEFGRCVVALLGDARARGLALRDVAECVRRCVETRHVRAACIECNRDQLHLLCAELEADHGYVSEGVELDELHAQDFPRAVERADVLVSTMFHAAEVQNAAKRLGKPLIRVALKPDITTEVARRLREGALYYVATDPRFETKLRRVLRAVAPVRNLRVALLGRDDLGQIPHDAPTFVMPSAQKYVAARWGAAGGPGRQIQPPRQFSESSARELLTFLVRANMTAPVKGMG
jgi:DNA-binding transcriptional regulator YhcF (GntR family)